MAEHDLTRLRLDSSSASRPRRRRWPWLAGGAALLAILGLVAGSQGETPVETVTVSNAYPYQALTLINAAGYVVAQRKAAVASKATGRLEWLGVMEGSRVKTGEVIARLEARDVQAQAEQAAANIVAAQGQLTQAEAEVVDATAAYERTKDLADKKFIAQSALDTAQARFHKARAAVAAARGGLAQAQAAERAARVAVDQTLIKAPFDGVVLTKSANVGDVITPFSSALDTKGAVVTMADMSTLEVEADVSEANLAKIAVGQPCEIQLDAFPDERFQGVVSRTVPTVDRSKATVLVKVRFLNPDPRILPEMSAKVAFLSKAVADDQRRPVLVVHQDALAQRGGQTVVFQMADGRARQVVVQAGAHINDLVAVSGLKLGDKVVAKPPEKLTDGDRIKPAAK